MLLKHLGNYLSFRWNNLCHRFEFDFFSLSQSRCCVPRADWEIGIELMIYQNEEIYFDSHQRMENVCIFHLDFTENITAVASFLHTNIFQLKISTFVFESMWKANGSRKDPLRFVPTPDTTASWHWLWCTGVNLTLQMGSRNRCDCVKSDVHN